MAKKNASYGHYGSDEAHSRVLEPGGSGGREPYQGEQEVPISLTRPNVREWASSSYDRRTGKEHIFSDGPRADRQVPGKSRDYTASKSPTRPGRW